MVEQAALTEKNPFLAGNFAPVKQEITAPLEVIGEIPQQLKGCFLRNGHNPSYNPLGDYHWFDGDGMLHEVEFNQGNATYRNRYVRTKGFLKEEAAGKALYGGILGPSNLDSEFAFKNVSNTALICHNDKVLSLWEGGEPYAIKVPSLETIGPETFDNKLNVPFTAHPKVDPITQEMMFIGYTIATPPYLYYGIVSPQGELVKLAPINLPVGVMMHDFAITENYTILPNLPLTFRPERMQKGEPALRFETETPSYFGIVRRHGNADDVRWFETNSCFIFHTLNAYEDGDEVVLLACRMEATNVLGPADNPEKAARGDMAILTRWRFNLLDNSVTEEALDNVSSEFPTINPAFLGRKNRFGYTASMAPGGVPLFDGVIKYDLETGDIQRYKFGSGRYGGEVVFAPNPDGKTEDDGWLMTFVYDESEDASELLILSALDVNSGPVARLLIPQRVPFGFHGTWVG